MKLFKRKYIFVVVSLLVSFLIIITTILTGKPFAQHGALVEKSIHVQDESLVFPYDLTNPSQKYKLPHYLDELSGITYLEQNKLACIDDEEGTIYIFDYKEKKVTNSYAFGKDKDFEDIVIIDDTAYILQSNGAIFRVKHYDKNDFKVKKYRTPLSKKNNTEGLAYDRESNALLIACKDSPQLDDNCTNLEGKRAVYKFDLTTRRLSSKPVYVIDQGHLKPIVKYTSNELHLNKFDNTSETVNDDVSFQPSGIAIHPITRDIYIISSVGRMLIVLDRSGTIKAAIKLDKKIFKQPEGICFSPDGDLFISDESRDGKANILQFTISPTSPE